MLRTEEKMSKDMKTKVVQLFSPKDQHKLFLEQQIFEIEQGQEEIKKKFGQNLQTNIPAANVNVKQQLRQLKQDRYWFNAECPNEEVPMLSPCPPPPAPPAMLSKFLAGNSNI